MQNNILSGYAFLCHHLFLKEISAPSYRKPHFNEIEHLATQNTESQMCSSLSGWAFHGCYMYLHSDKIGAP